jgi:hypothetical protein
MSASENYYWKETVAGTPESNGGEADVLVFPASRVKLNLLSRLNLKRKVLKFLCLTKT